MGVFAGCRRTAAPGTPVIKPSVAVAVFALTLGGCVLPPKETRSALIERAPVGGKVDQIATGFSWPTAGWWKEFRDPQLDALIAQSLKTAPGVRTAQARVEAARASTRMLAADSGMRLSSRAGVSRQRLSDSALLGSRLTGIEWYNQADASLNLDVDFDWWGRERARLTAGLNRERAVEAERQAAELMLVTALTSNYLAWQNYTERFANAQRLVATLAAAHRLQTLRVQQGIESAESLAPLVMEQARADDLATVMEGTIVVKRLEMAALAGIAPDRLPLPRKGRAVVPFRQQPADAGLGILARRPDIVASRWRVEAAAQGVAEARAGYYPDIRLSALAGLSSTDLSKFFDPGSRVFSVGAALYLPLFDARRVKARHGVQHAELELAIASYNETVVAAALEVGLQVLNWEGLPRRYGYLQRQLAQAQLIERAVNDRETQGIEDALAGLKAKADVLRLQETVLESEAMVVSARIALIKSLGGGRDAVNLGTAAKPASDRKTGA